MQVLRSARPVLPGEQRAQEIQNPAFQETGHITVPPHHMQPSRGAAQRGWAPLSRTKLYVTFRQTTFSHFSNKFQSELVNEVLFRGREGKRRRGSPNSEEGQALSFQDHRTESHSE